MIASSYKEQKQIPVIAAGGISTGEDIAHFMGLGAAGVQMGSIFVTTRNVTRPRRSRKYIFTPSPKMFLLLKVLWECQDEAIDGEFIHNVNSGLERPKSCSFHCIKTCDYTKALIALLRLYIMQPKGNMKKGYAFCR